MIRRKTFFVTLIASAVGACVAQTPVHVFLRPERPSVDAVAVVTTLRDIVNKLDVDRLRTVEASSWEGRVVSAATRSAAAVLGADLDGTLASGLYTLPTDQGDTLIAHWRGSGSMGASASTVWLWDTPFTITFVIETAPEVLSPENLKKYVEGLFLWDQDPIHLKRMNLFYLDRSPSKETITGMPEHIQTALGSYQLWFAVINDKGRACIGVGMSKGMFWDKYPPEAFGMRERFPPLRSRLTGVPKEVLYSELGKGYVAPPILPYPTILTYPTSRDAIVMSELLSRDHATDSELRQMIIGNFDKGDAQSALVVRSRLSAFLQAVGARGELALYAPALEQVFLETPIQRGFEDAVIAQLFGAMEEHHIDISHAALAFLTRGQYVGSSLFFYLGRLVQDDETLQRLIEIRVEPDLEVKKQAAVDNIKRRLSSR